MTSTETATAERLHEAAAVLRAFAAATERGNTAPLHPRIVTLLADWLGCLSALEPAERAGDDCGWCSGNHADSIARAVLGTPTDKGAPAATDGTGA